MPLALEEEPAFLETCSRRTPTWLPALEIRDEPDALFVEVAEGISAIAAAVEDKSERAGAMSLADLLHCCGKGSRQRVVQRLREEEQGPPPGIVDVHVRVSLDGQAAFGIPALGDPRQLHLPDLDNYFCRSRSS